MSNQDLSAIPRSAFNPFLYAAIATESNGSSLTMLSVFARLGIDPWAEAARWRKQQKDVIIARLIKVMEESDSSPPSIEGIQGKAKHIAALLPISEWLPEVTSLPAPIKATAVVASLKKQLTETRFQKWLPIAAICLILAIGVVYVLGNFN